MSTPDVSTWRELLDETTELLGDRNEARWMCEEASGLDGTEFVAELDRPATQRMGLALQAMVGRRLAGEPLQYVLGHWPFRHIDLLVDRRVLIPRPETELVAETALGIAFAAHGNRGERTVRIADLGTGSGAIGLAIANEMPNTGVEVWITDTSADALDVARANIAGIGRNAANVRVAFGEWCAALPDELRGSFDVVVSNPPYIAVDDADLDASVRDHEPHAALFSANDGLADVFAIAAQAREWLTCDGWLVLEIGHLQGVAVHAELERLGFANVEVKADLAGRDRIEVAVNAANA
ncbi:MAG: peptide chain release factor N(5)-glutamine methyltransferase [Actinomycetota bacterium]